MTSLRRALKRARDPLGFGATDLTLEPFTLDGLEVSEGEPLEQTARLLCQARRVLVFAGSGLSAESGIATFRDTTQGLYNDEMLQRVTHASSFETDRAWQLSWHERWREHIAATAPNAGHHALATLTRRGGYTLVTQNVDTLLEQALRAARLSQEVLHLHGTLQRGRCHACGAIDEAQDWASAQARCQVCGGPLRPDVIWFGERLAAQVHEAAREAARGCDVCLLLGTSGVVYPAAMLPEEAQRAGARLIEINPNPSALTEACDVVWRAPTGEALPQLLARLTQLTDRPGRVTG